MNETPGTLIGLSNVMTRVTARTAPGPDPDTQPGLRDRLRTRAMRALEGRESFIHDAILLGRRVRLFSNSHHLADFWKENWPGEGDWKAHIGTPLPREPILTVHAMIDVEGEPEASYFSASRNEVYLFNTSYYGDLRASTMESLGRALSPEGRFLHGTAVETGGRMLLCLYPKEVIHPTPSWGFLEAPGSRLLGDGWLFRDMAGRLHAVEKGLYLRTSFVESYPDHAAKLLRSKFENVPDALPALADPKMPALQGLLEGAARNDPRGVLRGLPPDRQKDLLLRLIVSVDSRVLVEPAAILGPSRLTRGPAVPAAVFDLKAGRGAEAIRPAKLDWFAGPAYEVSVGAVTGHPRELARLIAAR